MDWELIKSATDQVLGILPTVAILVLIYSVIDLILLLKKRRESRLKLEALSKERAELAKSSHDLTQESLQLTSEANALVSELVKVARELADENESLRIELKKAQSKLAKAGLK